MSQQLRGEWFVSDATGNAVIAWLLTAVLVVATAYGLVEFRMVAVILAGTAVLVAVAPAVDARSWTRTVPWPLLLLASAPILLGTFRPTFFNLVVSGVGIAGLGMLLVATLQVTTAVRMTPGFAIGFTVLTTLAFAGYWAVGSAASARYLGTGFVETNTALMHVFTAALVGGLVGGGVFRWYFRRRLRKPGATSPAEEVTFA